MKSLAWAKMPIIGLGVALNVCHAAPGLIIRMDQASLNTVTRDSYGSGFGYANPDIRTMFLNQDKSGSRAAGNSYSMLTGPNGLNFGIIRFPGGDPSFKYRWNKPAGSFPDDGHSLDPLAGCFLSPADLYAYFSAKSGTINTVNTTYDANSCPSATPNATPPQNLSTRASLGSNLLFQVNTLRSWTRNDNADVVFQVEGFKNGTFSSTPLYDGAGNYLIDEGGLKGIAQMAREWVENDRKKPYEQQAEYWEIGNEDWVRWTPGQYALIFNAVATEMIKANDGVVKDGFFSTGVRHKALRLIAQASVKAQDFRSYLKDQPTTRDPNKIGINQTAYGTQFIDKFAAGLLAPEPIPASSNNPNPAVLAKFDLKNVYGVALHPYVDGAAVAANDTLARTQNVFSMFNQVDAQADLGVAKTAVQGILTRNNVDWKILTTEYAIMESKDPATSIPYQDKAQGMLLADWTASMLALGVDKVFPFTLDNGPSLALFQYEQTNLVAPGHVVQANMTLENPRWMPGGVAMQRLINSFQGSMYKVAVSGVTSPTSGSARVKGLSAYAVTDFSKNVINLLLINRDPSASQSPYLMLYNTGTQVFDASKKMIVSEFKGNGFFDDNFDAPDHVLWSSPTLLTFGASVVGTISSVSSISQPSSYGTSDGLIVVPPASMLHVQIPIK